MSEDPQHRRRETDRNQSAAEEVSGEREPHRTGREQCKRNAQIKDDNPA